MRFYSYSPERRSDSKNSYYLIAIILGIVAVFVVLGLGYGFIYLLKLIIEYWILVTAIIIIALVLRKYFKKKQVIVQHADPYQEF